MRFGDFSYESNGFARKMKVTGGMALFLNFLFLHRFFLSDISDCGVGGLKIVVSLMSFVKEIDL